MMMNRTTQINTILARRRPLAEQIERVQSHLRSMAALLTTFDHLRGEIIQRRPDLTDALNTIDVATLRTGIDSELTSLAKLKQRFARPTLNIGVIGRARQGKSLLLQSLSGLTATEIPTGNLLHCTGVCSVIQNDPIPPSHAEITCYSEQEFLAEIIAPYYDLLGLGAPPLTIAGFEMQHLPMNADRPFDPDIVQQYGRANLIEKYRHLYRYQEHLNEYRRLLEPPHTRPIPVSEFRRYVAQYSDTGQPTYNYMAVRAARITCAFPHSDLGAIAVIDMPGLGDTGIGNQERLIETLGDLVDFVLFVKKPAPGGDFLGDVDVQLYDTARRALPLPIAQWSMLVLNQVSPPSGLGDNTELCQKIQAELPASLQFVDSMIVDCANPTDVRHDILDRVLAYLLEHIRELDQQYADACRQSLLVLHQHIHAELERASQALSVALPRGGTSAVFRERFDALWQELTRALETHVRDLHTRRDTESTLLEHAIAESIWTSKSINLLPTLEQIQDRRDLEGSYTIAYHQFLHDARTRLTSRLSNLDPALDAFVDEVRNELADLLKTHGRLGQVVAADGAAFFAEMARRIPEDAPELRRAFAQIATFQLSYRGFLHHRVRKHLDKLTPDLPNSQLKDITSASDVQEHLELFYGETVARVEQALHGLLTSPNEAAFAVIEEFIDQILRTPHIARTWEGFYDEVKLEVWPEIFGDLTDSQRIQEEWHTVVKRVQQANQPERFQFEV